MTTIAAIPTRYAGVQFRSRLEARWAAFFDLCGWKWEYEPIDLKGYIPDFVLTGLRGQNDKPIVVEVKPIRLRDSVDDVARKAFNAGVSSIGGWFAVVGLDFSRPDPRFTDGGDITIGRLAFTYGPGGSEIATRPFDLWWCDEWIWVYGGKDSGTTPTQEAADQVEMWWREAGNRVQWRGRGQLQEAPRAAAPSEMPAAPPPTEEVEVAALLADHPSLVGTSDADRAFALMVDDRLRDMYAAARDRGASLIETAASTLPQRSAVIILSGKYAEAADPAGELLMQMRNLEHREMEFERAALIRDMSRARDAGDLARVRALVGLTVAIRNGDTAAIANIRAQLDARREAV